MANSGILLWRFSPLDLTRDPSKGEGARGGAFSHFLCPLSKSPNIPRMKGNGLVAARNNVFRARQSPKIASSS